MTWLDYMDRQPGGVACYIEVIENDPEEQGYRG